MGAWQDSDIAIGIVADPCNFAAEQFFEKQLSLSASKCPDCTSYNIVPDALAHTISPCGTSSELSNKFSKGYKVVVAIVGVPDSSSYKADIHGLLDAWQKSAEKPSLLLVSNKPELTQQLVESWHGWKKLPVELKPAIKVNDEYLVISGNKALDVLKERVATAQSIKKAMSESHDTTMEPSVAEPLFTRSRTLSTMPHVVKG